MPKYNFSTFSVRLFIIFSVLIIGVGIFGYQYYEKYKESIKKINGDQLSAIADLKVHEISKWRQERIEDAKVISKTPFIASYVEQLIKNQKNAKLRHEILTWMTYIKGNYDYNNIILCDNKGTLLLSLNEEKNISQDILKRYIASEIKGKKEIGVIDLHRDESSHNIQLEIFIPVFIHEEKDTQPVGFFLLRIDPYKFLYPLIQSWPTFSQTAETLLVRREGNDVVFLNELRHRKNTALTLRFSANEQNLAAAMVVRGKEGLIEGFDYRGKRVFAALRSIPNSPWFLVSKIDVDEVYAPIRERAWIVIGVIIILIISAGLSIGLLWGKQVEDALRKAHDKLEVLVQERTAEIKKANRALRMLYECNQITAHATEEIGFLKDICNTIVGVGGYHMAWIGYAEQDQKKTVRPVAQAGYEEGYLESLNVTWEDNDRGRGPTGTAIRTGKPCIARNISTDPNFVLWRTEAIKRGYASSVAIPLIAEGRTLGAVMMYAIEPDAFDIEEVKLLEEMADDIAYCISGIRVRAEHKRMDEELRRYREHLEEMVEIRTEELKQLADELKRSNDDLEQFAFAASHDLQEPLHVIKGFLGLFEKRYKDKLDEKAYEFIRFSMDSAKRMQELIRDLLEYSRVGTKGKEFEPTDCSLILEKALFNLKASITESGAEVTHDSLPTITADGMQLGSLFQNLIGNAIKFHGAESPKVHIAAERKGDEWLFSVRDNGIGIDPKFADRIFSVFQRLHTVDEYPGTGIGLAICKKIVERHGGRIWVESEPGKGATFYFTIPERQSNI